MCKKIYPSITVDYREVPSGIPDILKEKYCFIEMKRMKTGDYVINEQVVVERKTKDDFVVSLIEGRLFKQCYHLRKSAFIPTLIIEGNPFCTGHAITREAIRGALLSVSVAWQIPINYTSSVEDTVQMLWMIAQQNQNQQQVLYRRGYKPKTLYKRQQYFLQGLPMVGPKIAAELLQHFGTIEGILKADEKSLLAVPGMGKERIRKIKMFMEGSAKKLASRGL
ncbi:ERCC4 domain-containing protein [Saccharicrinis fermentans]|nr:ERCC4 domain-containing protein [Saccharicrinis fermentans]